MSVFVVDWMSFVVVMLVYMEVILYVMSKILGFRCRDFILLIKFLVFLIYVCCFCIIGIRKWFIKWLISIVGEEYWEIIGFFGIYSILCCKVFDFLKFLMFEV